MLSPKRTKFRKAHKGRIHGNAKGGTTLNFGAYGLKATTPERVTARQIEAARRTIMRKVKRTGRLWIRIFPDVPVSSKPAEVRLTPRRRPIGLTFCPIELCLFSYNNGQVGKWLQNTSTPTTGTRSETLHDNCFATIRLFDLKLIHIQIMIVFSICNR